MSELFEDLDQQRAAGEERDAETLVRHALDLVVNAKQMPLSASVLISKDEVAELLQGALQRMPDELRQARWLLKEREDFIAEKSREADVLLEEVRVQAERMVQRTEIVRQANHVAQRILDDANEEARRLRHEVEDYADQKLASFEIVLDRTLKTVRAGREKLQVSPIPPVEIGEQGDTSLASPLASTGEPGALGTADRSGAGSARWRTPTGSSIRTSTERGGTGAVCTPSSPCRDGFDLRWLGRVCHQGREKPGSVQGQAVHRPGVQAPPGGWNSQAGAPSGSDRGPGHHGIGGSRGR